MGDVRSGSERALPRLESGSVFAGYRIEGLIDRGGMGVVYLATDPDLDRKVALKIIAPEHTQNATAVARFKAESRLAASLEHPNIVAIHRGGEEDGILYLAMRYVPGTNLREVIDRGPRDLPRVGRIMTQLASALDAAHARGLVHRDVKPANILISGEGDHEQVYLTDFGLTKRLGSSGDLTRAGAWVGTPDYVAPEQIQGRDVDRRADVYSLGCVLYEMLTGQVAYPKDSDMAKLWAHVTDPPPLPRTQRPELVGAFDEVVARATTKEPDDRYATAGEMAGALQAATALQDAAVAGPELGAGAAQFATRGETLGERSVFPDAPPLPPSGEAVHEAEGRFTPEPPAPAGGARPPAGAAVAQSGRGGEPPDPPRNRPGRGGRGGGGGSGGRPGRRGSGAGGGWISRHRGLLAGGLALIVAAIAAVVLLGNGSSDKTPAPAPERGQRISAKLGPVPTNRVHGDGSAVMRLDGKKLKVTITTGGLLDGAPHAMHLHGGKRGLCPPSSVAGPHNGHISIATHAGVPYYGPVVQSLTTKGDVSPKSFLAFSRYPNTGAIHYTRTIKVSGVVAAEIRQRNAVLVVHGIDYNGNGLYDGTLDRSELDRSLTGESTAPALCGPLVPAKQAARSKKTAEVPAGSGGGETFTATFAPQRQPAVRWICPLIAPAARGSRDA